ERVTPALPPRHLAAAMKGELVDQHAGGLDGEDDEEEAHARHGRGAPPGEERRAVARGRPRVSDGRHDPRACRGAWARARSQRRAHDGSAHDVEPVAAAPTRERSLAVLREWMLAWRAGSGAGLRRAGAATAAGAARAA